MNKDERHQLRAAYRQMMADPAVAAARLAAERQWQQALDGIMRQVIAEMGLPVGTPLPAVQSAPSARRITALSPLRHPSNRNRSSGDTLAEEQPPLRMPGTQNDPAGNGRI